jgi:hypothetical protein
LLGRSCFTSNSGIGETNSKILHWQATNDQRKREKMKAIASLPLAGFLHENGDTAHREPKRDSGHYNNAAAWANRKARFASRAWEIERVQNSETLG